MRLTSPRIAPLDDREMTSEQRSLLHPFAERGQLFNIFRTLARRPAGLRAFLAWGQYVMSAENRLPARQREIVILRVGFLCKSGYEFAQHETIGLQCGLTTDDIDRIKAGAKAGWPPADEALIRMADELVSDHFVGQAAWTELRAHFDEEACMDAVFTAGQYVQVSMFLNTFGVQLDSGLALDPRLRAQP